MKKISKKGVTVLTLVLFVGCYGMQMVNVHAADEDTVSLEFSDESEPLDEESSEVLAEDDDEFSAEDDADVVVEHIEDGTADEAAEEIFFEDSEMSDVEDLTTDFSEETEIKSCGEVENTVFWSLDEEGIFKITGQGAMQNWKTEEEVPWNSRRQEIKKIEIVDGVTSIGSYAFSNCVNTMETQIPESVQEIGEYAFFNCSGLSTVTIG